MGNRDTNRADGMNFKVICTAGLIAAFCGLLFPESGDLSQNAFKWRLLFWGFVLALLISCTVGARVQPILRTPGKIILFALKIAGAITLMALLCTFFGKPALITGAGSHWLKGRIWDNDHGTPVEDALICSISIPPEWMNQELRESYETRFQALKNQAQGKASKNPTLIPGISSTQGEFILRAGFMLDGDDFHALYPLYGGWGKKYVWLIVRKTGYKEKVVRLNLRGMRMGGLTEPQPPDPQMNPIPDIILDKEISK